MQESSLVLYNDNKDYCLTSYDSSYGEGWLYGEPISSCEEGSYDDSYYLTYDEVDIYSSRSWCANGETNRDHSGTETSYNSSRTWLEAYFGSYWGENEGRSEEGNGAYGSSFEKEESSQYDGDKNGSYYGHTDTMQLDYTENQWAALCGLGFGDDELEDQAIPYNSSWDDWEETILYETIFGY